MIRLVLAGLALLATLTAAAADLKVRYPDINGMGPQGLGYKALALALHKSGQPRSIELVPSASAASRDRICAMLDNGDIDVADVGVSQDFERRYAAVYIPIDRGLLGWRMLLIRQADRAKFESIQSLAQLQQYRGGQGQGWTDTSILRQAGLVVATATTLPRLFPLLAASRFDYVPLGLNEIDDLLDRYRAEAPGVVVDRHLLLVYPFGRLFFVRKDEAALHEAIQTGLQQAFADGSYQRMLLQDPGYSKVLGERDFDRRLRLQIDNPFMSPEFRAIPSRYFLR